MRREWIEMTENDPKKHVATSPSMRREWIEIYRVIVTSLVILVSLHAEGVD